ncbi:MAG: prephenate dehydratase [Duodenibacillus sp.]|nr:prephenate dehydratase [Duodenibacillus sp.]
MQGENHEAIARLRADIDGVDAELVRLVARRAALARAIGASKAPGSPVYRPEREREVVAKALAVNAALDDGLDAEALGAFMGEVMSLCRAAEARPRVFYLGPQGTFTEMAVLRHFGRSVDAVACPTIEAVFHEAESCETGFAVAPVENSTHGTVVGTLDMLFRTPLKIIAETNVPIKHNLMNLSGSAGDIARVCAHPQALGQCRAWLAAHLPGAEQVSVASNAKAACMAAEDPSVAAIAAMRASEIYGLKVVSEGIQDNPRNITRFAVLGRQQPRKCQSAPSKTSFIFSVPDRPGALFRALAPLERHGVSMMRLESRPAGNDAWTYNFIVDVAGYIDDDDMKAAVAEMRELTSFLKVLGSYPQAMNC